MALIDLNIPAGVYRNGTDLQSMGRWRDASLIRWHDGVMRPVGGWRTRNNNAANASIRKHTRHDHLDHKRQQPLDCRWHI